MSKVLEGIRVLDFGRYIAALTARHSWQILVPTSSASKKLTARKTASSLRSLKPAMAPCFCSSGATSEA